MKLFIIPTPIAPVDTSHAEMDIDELPPKTLKAVRTINHFFAENAKTARQFLKAVNHPLTLQEINIIEIKRDSGIEAFKKMLAEEKASNNHAVGIVSECGCPVVADPGGALIQYAHQAGVPVVALAGSSSLTQALMASGFNGQAFAFHGYLPHQELEKIEALRKWLNRARLEHETQMFIETPYRSTSLITFFIEQQDIFNKTNTTIPVQTFKYQSRESAKPQRRQKAQPNLHLAVCANLLASDELILSQPLNQWTTAQAQQFDRKPAVFLLAFV